MPRKTVLPLLSVLLLVVTGLLAAQENGDPLTTFSSDLFVGSGDCGSCHSGLADDAGQDVSFDSNWRASMMANSARDPLWMAKVESEVLRTPALRAALEDKCVTCHMPMAHTEAHAEGSPVFMFDDGFLDETNDLHEAAMDGISCALCHQISDEALGDEETFSGHFPIDTTTLTDRPIYGKYSDSRIRRMSRIFVPAYSAHLQESEVCATCHTLYTTAYDENGVPVPGADPFPEQTAYLEWEHSVFGDGKGVDQSCQDCHMRPITGTASLANHGPAPQRADFGMHYFEGGNTFLLAMLRDHGADLGVTASTDQFDDLIRRSEAMMSEETAVLTVTSAVLSKSALTVDLHIDSATGHKFPTGIPFRRAWIHLVAADAGGRIFFESGAPLADGAIAGNDADLDPDAYEAHYDLISDESQVQIYEGVMIDNDQQVTYTLLRATAYAKDNRLLPDGFQKMIADPDIAVYGDALSDPNFVGGRDAVRYVIPAAGVGRPVTITAELLYQPLAFAAARDLASTDSAATAVDGLDGATIKRFSGYYATADHAPVLVSRATKLAGERPGGPPRVSYVPWVGTAFSVVAAPSQR